MNFKSYYLNIKKFFSDNLVENGYYSYSNVIIADPSDDPRKVLVIFPFNQDIFRVASYIFREIPYSKKNAQFHYIIRDDYSDYFNVRNGTLYKIRLQNKKTLRELLLELWPTPTVAHPCTESTAESR